MVIARDAFDPLGHAADGLRQRLMKDPERTAAMLLRPDNPAFDMDGFLREAAAVAVDRYRLALGLPRRL